MGLASDGEEELEFGRELVLGVEAVGEVNSADAAVGVDLDSKFKVSYRFNMAAIAAAAKGRVLT